MAKPYSALNRMVSRVIDDIKDGVDIELQLLGQQLYGDKWPAVLAHNAKRMTKGVERELTFTEKDLLIRGMKALKQNWVGE